MENTVIAASPLDIPVRGGVIDFGKRLHDLASGKITGEIPAIEYHLAACEIDRLRKALIEVVTTGWPWESHDKTAKMLLLPKQIGRLPFAMVSAKEALGLRIDETPNLWFI